MSTLDGRGGRGSNQHRIKPPEAPREVASTVAATPFRGQARTSSTVDPLADPFYEAEEFSAFDRTVADAAARHGVNVEKQVNAAGLWEGEGEPSRVLSVKGHPDRVKAFADEVATMHNQDASMVVTPSIDGKGRITTWDLPDATSPGEVIGTLAAAGIPGASLTADGKLIVVHTEHDDPHDALMARQALEATFGQSASTMPCDVDFVSSRDDTDQRATRADGSVFPGYERGAQPGDGTTWGSTPEQLAEGMRRAHGPDTTVRDLGDGMVGVDGPEQAWADASREAVKQRRSAWRLNRRGR